MEWLNQSTKRNAKTRQSILTMLSRYALQLSQIEIGGRQVDVESLCSWHRKNWATAASWSYTIH